MTLNRNTESINVFLPNKYQFIIEGIEDVIFNISSGQLPGITSASVATPFRKNSGIVSGDRVTVDEITLSFLLDEQFLTYITALNWINESVTKMSPKDVTILLNTAQNTPNVVYKLISAIPTSLSSIELTTIDESIEPITVALTLACDRIEIETNE